ncbi:PadR family transcriptional regulator [Nocardioides iriomotensis]|uniref:PadR family transcriptional regulator n=1 Tax=Nocardioides iriomotensis TaxID=715784 RepID=UPI001F0DE4F9|nr:PadR family transcriptional regulator [Nocardioides iriomotensis]
MERAPALTTTSFAILGLLAIQPWTTYELAVQMERTLNRVWPRARSRLYEEPKKLVAHGLATATKESVGRRPRTVYTITDQGRAALAEWLQSPGEGPSLEFEQHLKLFFADFGTREDALAGLAASRAWAEQQLDVFIESARAYLAGEGEFHQRSAVTSVGARFLVDFYDLVDRWAAWATEVVQEWPDDPSRADPTLAIDHYILQLAQQRASRLAETSDPPPATAKRDR